jgi:hypothetical protein
MPPTSRETPDVQAYRRVHDLQRLLPMWPAELADQSTEGRRRRIAKLRRALREERCRGLSGHWAYDLTRHAALFRAYRKELAAEHASRTHPVMQQLTPVGRISR